MRDNWINDGIVNTKGSHKLERTIAKKLLKIRILNTVSRPESNLIHIISNPIIIAPSKHKIAIGFKLKSLDGLINNKPPNNEIVAAIQRIDPTFSFKIIEAKNIANIGFKKLIAVASLIGIYKIDVNQIVTPSQPKIDRKKLSLIFLKL